jgi:hypothetical protein
MQKCDPVIHIAFQRMTWRDNARSFCQLFLGQHTIRIRKYEAEMFAEFKKLKNAGDYWRL